MTLGHHDGTTALLVVDVQYDLADPAGPLYVAGGEEIVPLLNVEINESNSIQSSLPSAIDSRTTSMRTTFLS